MALDLEVEKYIDRISTLPFEEQRQILDLFESLDKATEKERLTQRFIPFVKKMWPGFIEGDHHNIMADAFERVADGKLKRLIVNMPPRHTKSEFASYLLPAWLLGRYPE